jgi:hypothetical protein
VVLGEWATGINPLKDVFYVRKHPLDPKTTAVSKALERGQLDHFIGGTQQSAA